VKVELQIPGRMEDRTVVITGASSGVGRAAARELASLGATVAVVGRNPDRTHAVADEVGGKAYLADFQQLASVRSLAEQLLEDLPQIHVLANNAGGLLGPATTVDGFDATFQQNHLAAFLLTSLLLPRLLDTAATAPEGSVRIIQTASTANVFGHVRIDDLDMKVWDPTGWRRYGTSKLENILFTRELARRLAATPVSAYAFHPGFIGSRFGPNNAAFAAISTRLGRSPEDGAQPLVRLAASPRLSAPSGNYFDRLRAPGRVARQANDGRIATQLWAASVERAGLRRE
jgi:NAD(P)-dependent dehydrogenase (short-subunit alcohol dehydrogenase family)